MRSRQRDGMQRWVKDLCCSNNALFKLAGRMSDLYSCSVCLTAATPAWPTPPQLVNMDTRTAHSSWKLRDASR